MDKGVGGKRGRGGWCNLGGRLLRGTEGMDAPGCSFAVMLFNHVQR